MKGYELVYGKGGHGGPYATHQEAFTMAVKLLKGSSTETVIYLVPRSAPYFHHVFAIMSVHKRPDGECFGNPLVVTEEEKPCSDA